MDNENQGNILDSSDTSSSESENEEDNFMVNTPLFDKTLEEPTPLPQDNEKKKQTKGPINSLETAWRQFIDENDYENYVPSILKNSTESEINKELYQLEKSTVSRGCLDVANTSKRAAHPEKSCQNNTSIIEIWKQFVTMEIIDLILIIQI